MGRHEKKKGKGVGIWIGIALCICVMAFAGYHIYTDTKDYAQGDQVYASLQNAVLGKSAEAAKTRDVPSAENRIDMNVLHELSGNAAAWIYSEGTVIDYPIMQGQDNSFYLKHLYDGTQNKMGSIFLDYRNAPDFSDQNSILYGHHMKSGKMFAELEKYKEQGYYESHPTMILFTRNTAYRVDLLAGYVADGEKDGLSPSLGGEEEFTNFVSGAKGKSTFTSAVTADVGDRLITMVTCTYDFQNARYVLVGKLSEIV